MLMVSSVVINLFHDDSQFINTSNKLKSFIFPINRLKLIDSTTENVNVSDFIVMSLDYKPFIWGVYSAIYSKWCILNQVEESPPQLGLVLTEGFHPQLGLFLTHFKFNIHI